MVQQTISIQFIYLWLKTVNTVFVIMYMYAYTYAYIYIHMYIYTHIYIHTNIKVNLSYETLGLTEYETP